MNKKIIKAIVCIIALTIGALVFNISKDAYFITCACILGGLVAAND